MKETCLTSLFSQWEVGVGERCPNLIKGLLVPHLEVDHILFNLSQKVMSRSVGP